MTVTLKRSLFIASFMVPTFVLYCIFTAYPIIQALYISLLKWSGSSANKEFIGLANFREMLHDPVILKAVANDYFLVFWKIVGIMTLSIFFAVAITRFKIKGAVFYKIAFYIPNLLSIVVIAILWRFIYHPSMGLLNAFLSLIMGRKIETPWLGDKTYAIWALLPPAIWAGIGFFMILLIAAITSIPTSLYESSEIDGASQWKQFIHITFPLIWEQVKVSVVYIVISSLNGNFGIVQVMTPNGGTDNSTQVMGFYLYDQGFLRYHMGYASSIGVLILVLSLLTTVILQRLMRREVHEVS
ncbi:sugar ABC transporter permease [Paenibacillus psychroresistens]|uniref:Sugar ABC transporter permease n=1 Tax=Paenibacillus psychroresistens TaxID=1778678 RepID=A0A6B8RR91_9BACL|nr:sugar ABC transporter permease [Paenibacillus psychroresistens]QGQ98065.1 sugar ABC transporter permease [Paenibacillus psychroresistens]